MDVNVSLFSMMLVLASFISIGFGIRSYFSEQKAIDRLEKMEGRLKLLLQDANAMNMASEKGQLDIRIDESRYSGDYQTIAKGINDTMNVTISVLREVSSNLTKLSSGDFSAQVTSDMVGDYKTLKEATNLLGNNLNNLIVDSTLMNAAAIKGDLVTRIDVSKYQGDFGKITNGINNTMEVTVAAIRDIGISLNRLSSGDFTAQVTTNMVGDYLTLKDATNRLATNLNNLIVDSNVMNIAASKGDLDVRIDASKYQGDFSKITNGINDTINVTVSVLRDISINLGKLSSGNFSAQISGNMVGDYEVLKTATNQLSANLMSYAKANDEQTWIKDGSAQLSSSLAKTEGFTDILQTAISTISRYTEAGKGAIYLYDPRARELTLQGSYAFIERNALSAKFKLGEGVVGQVALEKQPILLRNIQRTDSVIATAIINEPPINTYTFPLVYKDQLVGVIELASHQPFDEIKQTYFAQSIEILSASIFAAQKASETEVLLIQTQQQAEELEVKAREVELQNAELEQQKEETERQAQELEVAQQSLQQQNDELIQAQKALQKRAEELASSNKYKGEFLANMTHELRTPLNAINVLSGLLKKNTDGNLTEKQIEHVNVIHYSGGDLLNLINDLLDLSRIEAGQMSVSIETFNPVALAQEMKGMFDPLAHEKGLTLTFHSDQNLPNIQNDKAKLRQIIKNFMSNALKFTDKGGVTIEVVKGKRAAYPIEIHVKDTGCGIPANKIEEIFESFRQVDGSTTRKFGGTGLGLTISRELAHLLGGDIVVQSEIDNGSTFMLLLPEKISLEQFDKKLVDVISEERMISTPKDYPASCSTTGEKKPPTVLVIDDDPVFAGVIQDELKDLGYVVLRAENGKDGVMMAKKHQPDGILLDRKMPLMGGEETLKLLKRDPHTRHIPVKIVSVEDPDLALRRHGAVAVLQKPLESDSLQDIVSKLISYKSDLSLDVLIVEDDIWLRTGMQEILTSCIPEAKLSILGSATEALKFIENQCPSVMVMDLGLPDMNGFDLIDQVVQKNCNVPIIVYTGRSLNPEQLKKLREYTDSIILKTSDSIQRLVDEVTLFLHRAVKTVSVCKEKASMLEGTHQSLKDREILVVDDDIRNLFSMKALLESSGMKVTTANNGYEALSALKKHSTIEAVLTDIMMPEMDGYQLIGSIRADKVLAKVPVIALTAKVGDEEREKCIKAGADDYLSKPIDEAMLLELLRVWLVNSYV